MTSVHHMKPVRSKPTKTFNDHKKYKSQLEKDFYKCCGYCDDHHGFSGGSKFFHVDHLHQNLNLKTSILHILMIIIILYILVLIVIGINQING